MGDTQIFGGLSTEVVATGAAICDKAATWGLNRVAKHHIVDDFMAGIIVIKNGIKVVK